MAMESPRRVLVFGNSGAGKSTLARHFRDREGLGHLDLDSLAWLDTKPPQRRPVESSRADMEAFMAQHGGWVIEGCYADLLTLAAEKATEMIWLNPPTETCVAHARARPWEPHKYPSKEAQDANLPMLIDWICAYDSRDDEFSRRAHTLLFEQFPGTKRTLTQPASYAG
jgi:adenylate kinase family enzyme